MRVGLDLDGVLFNFGQSVREYLDSLGKSYGFKNDAAEPHCWDFYEYWEMTRAEFAQHCHDGVDAGYIFRNNVRDNAVDAVREIKRMGHKIVVITDRSFGTTPAASEQATVDWWNWAGLPQFDELHFSPNKTIVSTDIFVEDKTENFQRLWAAGTECWLITRPWNAEFETKYRINDIKKYPGRVALKAFRESQRVGT